MSLYNKLEKTGLNGFGCGSTAEQITDGLDLSDRTFLLTGCSAEIGLETLRVLTLRGARVIATARTLDAAAAACAGLGPAPGEGVPMACDLSEPSSIRALVAELRSNGTVLSGIVANEVVMAPSERIVRHGLELQFLVNHVGHFLLVAGMLDRLTFDARVVVVSSPAHRWSWPEGLRLDDLAAEREYSAWSAYGQSKLANLLFARHLAERLAPDQTANSLHQGEVRVAVPRPGGLAAGLMQDLSGVLGSRPAPGGAATQCYLVAHPSAAKITGQYLADCNPIPTSAHGSDDGLAVALWERTEEIVARLG